MKQILACLILCTLSFSVFSLRHKVIIDFIQQSEPIAFEPIPEDQEVENQNDNTTVSSEE